MRTNTPPACIVIPIAIFFLAGCGRNPSKPSPERVRTILAKGSPFSESSFYACLLNGYAQGLPLKQVQADCETKLEFGDQKGFGPSDLLGPFAHGNTYFDPAKVSATCNSGDPERAAGGDKRAVEGRGSVQWNYSRGNAHVDWGTYSWGGKDQCDGQGCYKGLSEPASSEKKLEAIKKAAAARDVYLDAYEASKADPKNKEKKEAAARAKRAFDDAAAEALKDPNKKEKGDEPPSPASHPVGPDGGPCDQALQEAREIVGECQRTGWKSADCKSLLAKMNDCPDPTLIYVDPEFGYDCRKPIDPQVVKDAWVEHCRELRRPVPGGPDPCEPPVVDDSSRFVTGRPLDDVCNNPVARIDPDSDECLSPVTIQKFDPDLQALLVWGLNKLGGPIVVLPDRDPDPPSGRGPRPDPRP